MRVWRLTTGSTFTRSGIRHKRVQADKIEATNGHPERSSAESKDLVALSSGNASGFLDCARNDVLAIR